MMNRKKGSIQKWVARIVVLIVLGILPLVIERPYIVHLFIMTYISCILGMTFGMFFSTGLITLGAAAFYAVGAYASATLVMHFGMSFWAALPLVAMITALISLAFGSVIVRHPGVSFVVITLLFAHVVAEAIGQIDFLGGWGGIMGIPRPEAIGSIRFVGKMPFYYLILGLALLIALVYYALYQSRIGRVWQAIKLSPHLAETLGISLYRYRLLAFVIGSAAAGIAGSFYAHYFQMLTPEAFGGWLSIYIQLYAVLGGLEFYILGPAVGALIMTFVPEFLRTAKEVEPIITGGLLLVLILFYPGGILGLVVHHQGPRSNGMKGLSRRIRTLFNSDT